MHMEAMLSCQFQTLPISGSGLRKLKQYCIFLIVCICSIFWYENVIYHQTFCEQ